MPIIKRGKQPETQRDIRRRRKFVRARGGGDVGGGKRRAVKSVGADAYFDKCRRVFEGFSDEDFYGPRATHVYFYGPVTKDTVQKLRVDLYAAQKPPASGGGGGDSVWDDEDAMGKKDDKDDRGNSSSSSGTGRAFGNSGGLRLKPKPIVLHLHSGGGSAEYGMTMMNFLHEVEAPLCVLVDGLAASAATPLLVAAPYRVMHVGGFVMIHEGSTWLGRAKQQDAAFAVNQVLGGIMTEYGRVYSQNTQIPKKKLGEMLGRDEFMDAGTCKKWSVVDRVLGLDKARCMARWEKYMRANPDAAALVRVAPGEFMRSAVGLNHLFVYNNNNVSEKLASGTASAAGLMRLVRPLQAILESPGRGVARPLVIHTNLNLVPEARWFDVATLAVRVQMLPVPVFGVIDTNVDLVQAIPCIMAHRRYMYSNVNLYVHLIYQHQETRTPYYDDFRHNTEMFRGALRRVLAQHTKMPGDMLEGLFDRRIMLSAQDCLRYGIVDYIIDAGAGLRARRRGGVKKMSGGCSCSQGLAYNF